MVKQTRKSVSKKSKLQTSNGVAHIQATFNNTIVTLTTPSGDVVSWSSAGACGFKGARKSTPFAAKVAAETAARKSMDVGMRQINVIIKGAGSGREPAIRGLSEAGLEIKLLRDITSIPHNGCRPPKKRRI
uniref:Small ribosomal subunit protein uS11c n=1 Tax=Neodangemannia microcystis TaxID=173495 RepID=A0A1W6EHH1_9CHLO|nr:ribosomal protein S11 [Neodangemannia microcystis]ARK14785.1 ribosomal protein S11 [Neodangemannia microcystis]